MTIFKDDEDRAFFLERLVGILDDADISLHHFSLLDNHYHLVVEAGANGLPRAMSRLGTGYAMHFNRRHDRVGHVFQGRYGLRIPCSERHLRELDRYVVLNPIRAGLVEGIEELETCPWSSYGATVGTQQMQFVARAPVLRRYGEPGKDSIEGYRSWVRAGLQRSAGAEGKALLILERESQMEAANAGDLDESWWPADGGDLDSHRIKDLGIDRRSSKRLLAFLVNRVCQVMRIEAASVRGHDRRNRTSEARALIVHLGVRVIGVQQSEIARELQVSQPAISQLLDHQGVRGGDPRLLRVVSELAPELLMARDEAWSFELEQGGDPLAAVRDRPSSRDGSYAISMIRLQSAG